MQLFPTVKHNNHASARVFFIFFIFIYSASNFTMDAAQFSQLLAEVVRGQEAAARAVGEAVRAAVSGRIIPGARESMLRT